jgi:hypothetical protein
MKKSLLVTLSFLVMIIASLAFTTNDEPNYKNLKILPKDITEKQMDSVMHHYTASLNVKCNFCHVKRAGEEHPDFASDENKHKLRTREMMEMTNKINEKWFDLTGGKMTIESPLMVTCYTCHHGSKEPATKAQPKIQTWNGPVLTDSTKRIN